MPHFHWVPEWYIMYMFKALIRYIMQEGWAVLRIFGTVVSTVTTDSQNNIHSFLCVEISQLLLLLAIIYITVEMKKAVLCIF